MSKYRTDKIRPVSDDSALDETEAHGARWGGIRPQDEDTEGHGFRHAVPEDEDTEGHAARYRGALPEDEDTEGHGRFNV